MDVVSFRRLADLVPKDIFRHDYWVETPALKEGSFGYTPVISSTTLDHGMKVKVLAMIQAGSPEFPRDGFYSITCDRVNRRVHLKDSYHGAQGIRSHFIVAIQKSEPFPGHMVQPGISSRCHSLIPGMRDCLDTPILILAENCLGIVR